jgi:alcohol dehydrogenase class IV
MIGNFIFSAIPKIVFGVGSINELSSYSKKFGRNLLLITGGESLKKSGRLSEIQDLLAKEIDNIYIDSISNEPAPKDIDRITGLYHKKDINVIVAIGGGSVLDAGKAISAMMPLNEPIKDYLEGVGTKTPLGKKIPFIAIPTTSGTGSETTKNAVISEIGYSGFKKSLRHENYIPNIAIIDP